MSFIMVEALAGSLDESSIPPVGNCLSAHPALKVVFGYKRSVHGRGRVVNSDGSNDSNDSNDSNGRDGKNGNGKNGINHKATKNTKASFITASKTGHWA